MSIRDLVEKYGVGPKFVRAYCKARGWRYDAQGAPQEWYRNWPAISTLITHCLDNPRPQSHSEGKME